MAIGMAVEAVEHSRIVRGGAAGGDGLLGVRLGVRLGKDLERVQDGAVARAPAADTAPDFRSSAA